MGTIYKRGKAYWIKYYRDRSPRYESARTADKQEARRLLQTREGDAARGVPILPKAGRVSFGEAARDMMNEYVANGRRSVENLEQLTRKHLEPVFGNRYMAGITTSDVHNYIAARQTGESFHSCSPGRPVSRFGTSTGDGGARRDVREYRAGCRMTSGEAQSATW